MPLRYAYTRHAAIIIAAYMSRLPLDAAGCSLSITPPAIYAAITMLLDTPALDA